MGPKLSLIHISMHCIRMDELGLYLSAKGVEREWGDSWWGIPKEVKPKWAEFILAKVEDGVNDQMCIRDSIDITYIP